MDLLYTLTAYPPSTGGVQLHTHLLAQQLQTRHSVRVVCQWDSNRTDWLLGTTLRAPSRGRDYTMDRVNVHQFGLSWREKVCIAPYVLAYYPLMRVALPPIATCFERHLEAYAREADLIHNVRIGREGLSYASLQVARNHDIPFVLTPVHHPRWVGWRYRAYIRLYAMADLVLTLTNVEKRTLVTLGAQEERIEVVGNGPVLAPHSDPKAFLTRHNIDGPMILFLGQHYRYKGYQQVLQAAPLVWQKVPELHFVFIGPAVGRSEQAFIEMADRRIHRLGKVDLEEKTNALAACALLCVPSTQESFGGVYTEAWSCGKPVIGCNIPAVAEVVTDGADGYLVVQKPGEIADRIVYLVRHPSQMQAMGEAGRRKVSEKYTWEQIARRVEQAYHRTLDA
jgi:glycosyltransferase involved in cell wall biosynthesis